MENTANDIKPKNRYIIRIVLVVILAVLMCIAGFIWYNANRNVKAMNNTRSMVMAAVSAGNHQLHKADSSEFSDLKIYGIMKFNIEQYDIEDLGNLCIMRANAGIMQMMTVIITPVKKDMPLFSADYMYMLGSRTAYAEAYSLNISDTEARQAAIDRLKGIASDYRNLNDTRPAEAWYDAIRTVGCFKKVKSSDDTALSDMLFRFVAEYLDAAGNMELLPADAVPDKINIIESYTHRLITEGGVSTDVFKKKLGENKTTRLFDTVMFGTRNYI